MIDDQNNNGNEKTDAKTKASIDQVAFSNTASINTASINTASLRGSTMSDKNQYEQYGYDSFDGEEPAHKSPAFYSSFRARFASPGIATFVLLTLSAGVVWYAIVAEPKQPNVGDLPIIRADASSYKTKPQDAGGMEIANKNSTIFDKARGKTMGESAPVENLLSEQPVDKLEEFSKEASEIMEEKPMPKNLLAGSGDKSPETAQIVAASDEGATQATKKLENLVINAQPETLDSEPEVNQASVANTPKPSKKPDTLERPSALHAPGSSPETLAFVRNALEQASEAAPKSIPAQEPPASAAAEASSVEPASGFASGARRFYVQLSSITDQARSDAEWAKLQTRYPSMLDNAPHRVQRAELGDRGTFYRIQAGPFEKDGAVSICEQIKSVNPNGCLVVK